MLETLGLQGFLDWSLAGNDFAVERCANQLRHFVPGQRAFDTAECKSLSRDVAVDNVTINNLLPERIDTDRQRFMAERMTKLEGITYEQARAKIVEMLPAKRFGKPEEFGSACAFFCAAQSGFISGQNLQIDGGSYRGLV